MKCAIDYCRNDDIAMHYCGMPVCEKHYHAYGREEIDLGRIAIAKGYAEQTPKGVVRKGFRWF